MGIRLCITTINLSKHESGGLLNKLFSLIKYVCLTVLRGPYEATNQLYEFTMQNARTHIMMLLIMADITINFYS